MGRKPPTAAAENSPSWAADLTPRERRFVEEYLVDLNARDAAIRAGLGKTPKSSSEIACRLRRKNAVAKAIADLMNERSRTTGSRVVEELAKVAFAKMTDFVRIEDGRLVVLDTKQLTEDQQAAIAEISETTTESGRTIRIKLHDKGAALDRLAKVLNMYRERVELSGPNGGPIEQTVQDVRVRIEARLNKVAKNLEIEATPAVEIQPPVRRIPLPIPVPVRPPTIDG